MNAPAPRLQTAGMLRRLAAMLYDFILLVGIWLLGATVDTLVRAGLGLSAGSGSHLALQLFFVIAPLLFYLWFWTHGGQSLGMRAWKLRVVDEQGHAVDYKTALVRYLAACLSLAAFGLGFAWQLVDRDNLSWHDRLSRSRLIRTAS